MPDPKFPIPKIPKTFGVEQPTVEPLPAFVHPVWVPPAPEDYKPIQRSTKVATAKIYTPDGKGFCIITADEFNPHEHRIYQEPATDQA